MSNLNNNNNKKSKTVRLYKIGGYKQNDQGEFETQIPYKTNRRVQFNDPMINFNPYFNPYQPHSMAHYPPPPLPLPPPHFGSRMPPYGPPMPISYGQPNPLIYKDSKIKKLNSNLKSQNSSQPLRFYNQYHQDDFYSWNGYPRFYGGQEDRDGDDEGDDDEYDETDDTEEDEEDEEEEEEEDDDDDDDDEEEDESTSTTKILEKKNEIIQEPVLVQQENKITNVIRPKSTVVTKKFEIKGTTKKVVKITTANVVESPYVVSKPISKNKYQETDVLSNNLKDSLTQTDKNKLDNNEFKSNKSNNPLKVSETNLDKSSFNSKFNNEKMDQRQENHHSKSLVNISAENSEKNEQIESGQVESKAKPKINTSKSEIETSSKTIKHEILDEYDSTQSESKESKLKNSTPNLIAYHENKNEQVIVQSSKKSGNEILNKFESNQSIPNSDSTLNENCIQSELIPNPHLFLNSKNDNTKPSLNLKDSKSKKSSSNIENNEKSIMNSNKIENDETFEKLESNEEISKPILNSNNSNKLFSDEASTKQLKSEIATKNELSKEILQNEKSVTISESIKDFLVEKNDAKKFSNNNDKPILIKENSAPHLESIELVSKKTEKSVSNNNKQISQNQTTNKLDSNKNTDQIASVDNNSKDLVSKTPIQNSKPDNFLDENASKDLKLKIANSEKSENASNKSEKLVSKSNDQKVSVEFDSKLENNELIPKSNKNDLPTQAGHNLKDLEYKTALKNLEKLFENEIASKKIEKPINNSNNKTENEIPNKIDNTLTIPKLISNSKNDEVAIKHDSKDLKMKITAASSNQAESIKSNEPDNNLITNKNSNSKKIIPVPEKALVLESSTNLLESQNLLVSNRISPVVLNENVNTIVDKNFIMIPQVISYDKADFNNKTADSKKKSISTNGAKEDIHTYKNESLDKQTNIFERENFYEKNYKKITEKELILPTIVEKSSSFKEPKKSLKDIGNSKLKAYKNNKPTINKLRLVEKTTRKRPTLINEISKKDSNKLKTELLNKKSESIQNNSDLFLKDRENSVFFGKISKVEIPSPVSSVSPTSSSYQNLSDHDQRINEIIEENKIDFNKSDHKDLLCTCSHSTIDEGECEDEIDREKFANIPKLDKNTVNKKSIKVFLINLFSETLDISLLTEPN